MNVLAGRTVAISVGEPPNLGQLGIPRIELDHALISICTGLVRSGAKILYGGDLRPEGFTMQMFLHLSRLYAAEDTVPFVHVLPEPGLRALKYPKLHKTLADRRGAAQTLVCLDGELVPVRLSGQGIRFAFKTGAQEVVDDASLKAAIGETTRPVAEQHTAARVAAVALSDARVMLGGKMGIKGIDSDKFEGEMPGIVQEALLTLDAWKTAVPLGAYGGASRDVAIHLKILDAKDVVPRAPNSEYDQAMQAVEKRADKIPDTLRGGLRELAISDQAENVSVLLPALISQWIGLLATP